MFEKLLEDARDGDVYARRQLYREIHQAAIECRLTQSQLDYIGRSFGALASACGLREVIKAGSSQRVLRVAKSQLLFIAMRGSRSRSAQRTYGKYIAGQVQEEIGNGLGKLAACQLVADKSGKSLRQIQRYFYRWRE